MLVWSLAVWDTNGQPPKRVYRCLGSKNVTLTKHTPTTQINAELIEDFVWSWIVSQLEPENLRAGLLAERARSAEVVAELERQVAIQHRQEKELDNRLSRIQDG